MTALPLSSDSAPGARAWLASSVEASAVAAADAAFDDLAGCAPTDIKRRLTTAGLAPIIAWAETLALAGVEREPWAREAGLRAVRAYAGRLGELMAGAGGGGLD